MLVGKEKLFAISKSHISEEIYAVNASNLLSGQPPKLLLSVYTD